MAPRYLIRLLTEQPEWREEAVCTETDPELFFPSSSSGSSRKVKEVCFSCPVREQCLQFALDNGERFGIWGGLSEMERRALKVPTVGSLRRDRVDPVLVQRAVAMVDSGTPTRVAAREIGINRSTLQDALRRRRAAAA